jgi:hypothetical protein
MASAIEKASSGHRRSPKRLLFVSSSITADAPRFVACYSFFSVAAVSIYFHWLSGLERTALEVRADFRVDSAI